MRVPVTTSRDEGGFGEPSGERTRLRWLDDRQPKQVRRIRWREHVQFFNRRATFCDGHDCLQDSIRIPPGHEDRLLYSFRNPTTEVMVRFIDQHRADHGGEPICRVVLIAPSTYFGSKAQESGPYDTLAARSARSARRGLKMIIQRIWTGQQQALRLANDERRFPQGGGGSLRSPSDVVYRARLAPKGTAGSIHVAKRPVVTGEKPRTASVYGPLLANLPFQWHGRVRGGVHRQHHGRKQTGG